MKKILALMIGLSVISGLMFVPQPSFAGGDEGSAPGSTEGQGSVPGSTPGNNGGGQNNQNQNSQSNSTSFVISLKNPLKNIDTLNGLIVKILNIILTIGVPFVALMIIYSGFLFVKAQGDPGKLKDAKATLLWTLIGGTILLSAWVIAKALAGTVSQIVNGS